MEAARLLSEGLTSCEEAVLADLDLLLRWVALRLADANMQSSVKILDFTKELFAHLCSRVGLCLLVAYWMHSRHFSRCIAS